MAERIALFGGSFNPPGIHHRKIVETLARRFDKVLVVPCGPRPDKPVTSIVPPVYRAALADLTFGGLPRVLLDLSDLEQATFTRSHALETRYSSLGDVWHVVGVDIIKGGSTGQSEIHRIWEQGERLWKEGRFAVLTRPGHRFDPADMPPNSVAIEAQFPGSSTEIRDLIQRGEPVDHLLPPRTLSYIQRYGLYRAPIPAAWARSSLSGQPYQLQADKRNPKAQGWAERFSDSAHPQFITVIGGDGAMLRSIREHWRRRLPFYGLNAGHLGFLMNSAENTLGKDFPPHDVIIRQLPMLYLEMVDMKDRLTTAYGFNDAWVERDTSQSAWLSVSINGVQRLKKLVCDGALVSTAAGSTAYARAMGATPLLVDTPAWLLVGSNVMEPIDWKSALLSNDSSLEITTLDTAHRPVRAFVDGHDHGLVKTMRARISRAAAAEIIFDSDHDMAEKIADLQFRNTGLSTQDDKPS
jgi:NAD+ kinase